MNWAVIVLLIAALLIYCTTFYRFMKETEGMKDERGRRINQAASEVTLIIVQTLLLASLVTVELFESINPSLLLALIFTVAVLGHSILRYHYAKVM
ncbi:DUF2178 domain-containing protein [Thermococcus nautili]|uniref:Uncharacterized protein n=1 Tax=Thermococcus nautili TaxID=195522 RepID=W8NVT1_9EURY|nr:DUF2178 domain-containing protein [Thermococcus nautili]AHL23267.1 hypothetical protein BD01_1664 [Thermococcus nautili]